MEGLSSLIKGFKKEELPDMCKCSECGGVFKVEACPQEYGHHDGYEYTAYNEVSCPVCSEGGCVDDFWFSE